MQMSEESQGRLATEIQLHLYDWVTTWKSITYEVRT